MNKIEQEWMLKSIERIDTNAQRTWDAIERLPCSEHGEKIAKVMARREYGVWFIGILIAILGFTFSLAKCSSAQKTEGTMIINPVSEKKAQDIYFKIIQKHYPKLVHNHHDHIQHYKIYIFQSDYVRYGKLKAYGFHFWKSQRIFVAFREGFSQNSYCHELLHALSMIKNGHSDHDHNDVDLWKLEPIIKSAYKKEGL